MSFAYKIRARAHTQKTKKKLKRYLISVFIEHVLRKDSWLITIIVFLLDSNQRLVAAAIKHHAAVSTMFSSTAEIKFNNTYKLYALRYVTKPVCRLFFCCCGYSSLPPAAYSKLPGLRLIFPLITKI